MDGVAPVRRRHTDHQESFVGANLTPVLGRFSQLATLRRLQGAVNLSALSQPGSLAKRSRLRLAPLVVTQT
jgi:hypothetical protein